MTTLNEFSDPSQRFTMPDYQVPLRLNSGQVEFTVPSGLVAFHEFEGGEPIAFVPKLRNGTIEFRIFPGKGGWSNERRVKQVGEYNQTIIRFPKEFAVERGLFDLLKQDEEVTVTIETTQQKELVITTDPPMEPVSTPNDNQRLAEPYYTTLQKSAKGDARHLQIYLRQSWIEEDVLNLDGGEKFETYLSSRNGELALVLDLDVEPEKHGQTNVRTFFSHDLSYIDGVGRDYCDIRGAFSKVFAHGLDLARPDDKKISVKLWPEPNRLVMKRHPQSPLYWFY